MVLKGPALAAWLYEGERRDYVDADVLVPASKLDAAERALAAGGLQRVDRGLYESEQPRHAVSLRAVATQNECELDLHLGLAGAVASFDQQWDLLWGSRQELIVAKQPVWIPSPPALAVHVCLHAAVNGIGDARTMEDLRRVLAGYPASEWSHVLDFAEQLGCGDQVALALALLPAGRHVQPPRQGVPLAVRLRGRHGSEPVVRLAEIARQPPRQAITALAHELLPSRAFMQTEYPTASWGPAGLALAHLARWIRLLTAVPRIVFRLVRVWRRQEFK